MLPPWPMSSYQSEVPEHPVRNGREQSALVKWCRQPSAPLGGPPVSQGLLGSILPTIGGSSPRVRLAYERSSVISVSVEPRSLTTFQTEGKSYLVKSELSFPLTSISSSVLLALAGYTKEQFGSL